MKQDLEYKGYLGSVEVDVESMVVVGKLLHISDTIAYSSTTLDGIPAAFHAAVDDYLRACEEFGDQPDTPCKGSFNVRISPDLHRQAVVLARQRGMGLNDLVQLAIQQHCSPREPSVNHLHFHVGAEKVATEVTSGEPAVWKSLRTNDEPATVQ